MPVSADQPIIVPSTRLHQMLGAILKKVGTQGQHIIVERGGYPIIALIPIGEYHKLIDQRKDMPAK